MTKEDKFARVLEYHGAHGKWPTADYVEPGSGIKLGIFVARIKRRDISLTGTQRAALVTLDPLFFDDYPPEYTHAYRFPSRTMFPRSASSYSAGGKGPSAVDEADIAVTLPCRRVHLGVSVDNIARVDKNVEVIGFPSSNMETKDDANTTYAKENHPYLYQADFEDMEETPDEVEDQDLTTHINDETVVMKPEGSSSNYSDDEVEDDEFSGMEEVEEEEEEEKDEEEEEEEDFKIKEEDNVTLEVRSSPIDGDDDINIDAGNGLESPASYDSDEEVEDNASHDTDSKVAVEASYDSDDEEEEDKASRDTNSKVEVEASYANDKKEEVKEEHRELEEVHENDTGALGDKEQVKPTEVNVTPPVKEMEENMAPLVAMAEDWMKRVMEMLQTGGLLIKNKADNMLEAVSSFFTSEAGDGKAVFESFLQSIKEKAISAKEWMESRWRDILATSEDPKGKIAAFGDDLLKLLLAAWDNVQTKAQSLVHASGDWVDNYKVSSSGHMDHVLHVWLQTLDETKSRMGEYRDTLLPALSHSWSELVAFVGDLKDVMLHATQDTWENVVRTSHDTWENVVQFSKDVWENAKGKVGEARNVWEAIQRKFKASLPEEEDEVEATLSDRLHAFLTVSSHIWGDLKTSMALHLEDLLEVLEEKRANWKKMSKEDWMNAFTEYVRSINLPLGSTGMVLAALLLIIAVAAIAGVFRSGVVRRKSVRIADFVEEVAVKEEGGYVDKEEKEELERSTSPCIVREVDWEWSPTVGDGFGVAAIEEEIRRQGAYPERSPRGGTSDMHARAGVNVASSVPTEGDGEARVRNSSLDCVWSSYLRAFAGLGVVSIDEERRAEEIQRAAHLDDDDSRSERSAIIDDATSAIAEWWYSTWLAITESVSGVMGSEGELVEEAPREDSAEMQNSSSVALNGDDGAQPADPEAPVDESTLVIMEDDEEARPPSRIMSVIEPWELEEMLEALGDDEIRPFVEENEDLDYNAAEYMGDENVESVYETDSADGGAEGPDSPARPEAVLPEIVGAAGSEAAEMEKETAAPAPEAADAEAERLLESGALRDDEEDYDVSAALAFRAGSPDELGTIEDLIADGESSFPLSSSLVKTMKNAALMSMKTAVKGTAAIISSAFGSPHRWTKDEKLALLLAYHRVHKHWPMKTYKDPATGVELGAFWRSVVKQQETLNTGQMALVLGRDPKAFESKRLRRQKAHLHPYSSSCGKAHVSRDEKIAQLVKYREQYGKFPKIGYKDPETGVPLGAFYASVVDSTIKLTDEQRARLLEADPSIIFNGN